MFSISHSADVWKYGWRDTDICKGIASLINEQIFTCDIGGFVSTNSPSIIISLGLDNADASFVVLISCKFSCTVVVTVGVQLTSNEMGCESSATPKIFFGGVLSAGKVR